MTWTSSGSSEGVTGTISQLYARLYEEARYSITLAPNDPRDSKLKPPPLFLDETAQNTAKPVWHTPERSITLEAGTFSLKFKVYRHAAGEKEKLSGEARVLLHELASERSSDIRLSSPADHQEVGVLTLYLRPHVPQGRGAIDLSPYRQMQGTSALVSSLVTISQDLQSLQKTLGDRYTAIGISTAYTLSILQYIARDHAARPDTPPTPTNSPIWDLALQVELQLHHFTTRFWPDAVRRRQHAASPLASALLLAIAQSLALIFGFADCYTESGYTAIDTRSRTCGAAFRTLLFRLLALGAHMRGVHTGGVSSARALGDVVPREFLRDLAWAYARRFAAAEEDEAAWVDYLVCFRGRLAGRMGRALEKVAEGAEDEGVRRAARRLMKRFEETREKWVANGAAGSYEGWRAGRRRELGMELVLVHTLPCIPLCEIQRKLQYSPKYRLLGVGSTMKSVNSSPPLPRYGQNSERHSMMFCTRSESTSLHSHVSAPAPAHHIPHARNRQNDGRPMPRPARYQPQRPACGLGRASVRARSGSSPCAVRTWTSAPRGSSTAVQSGLYEVRESIGLPMRQVVMQMYEAAAGSLRRPAVVDVWCLLSHVPLETNHLILNR